jgi:hypothetical protein
MSRYVPDEEARPDPTKAPVGLMSRFLRAVSNEEISTVLRLAEDILAIEPDNKLILEYRDAFTAMEQAESEEGSSEEEEEGGEQDRAGEETTSGEDDADQKDGDSDDDEILVRLTYLCHFHNHQLLNTSTRNIQPVPTAVLPGGAQMDDRRTLQDFAAHFRAMYDAAERDRIAGANAASAATYSEHALRSSRELDLRAEPKDGPTYRPANKK